MINFYEEKVDQINVFTVKADKKELSIYVKDFDAILNSFNIDLEKFIKHGEELQILLNEIVSVSTLFKKCLLVLNQKECELKDATINLISKIKTKYRFMSFMKMIKF
ncbi:hypothetical protein A0H76_2632 [Hepatospora eriocheir]|uniref:Uncharacterized protein n=1 Tax=Hepatospora eriocheir TaxID=1081669 RepID=A0A1X0QF18_9MICR|nr:hypothetical protein A0H76_2632 [Hepatospora eriocheir]